MQLVLLPLFGMVATAYPTTPRANNKELESSSNTKPVANSWNYDPSHFNEIQAHVLFTGEDAECLSLVAGGWASEWMRGREGQKCEMWQKFIEGEWSGLAMWFIGWRRRH